VTTIEATTGKSGAILEDGGDGRPGPIDPGASQEAIWGDVCKRLRAELTPANYSAWFSHTRVIGIEGSALLVGVPSSFAKQWIEERYLHRLRTAVHEATGSSLDVILLTDYGVPEVDPEEVAVATPKESPAPAAAVAPGPPERALFHTKYTFDSFVIGSSNRFAHAAALAVAEGPGGGLYNPLFVYGHAGLGKTHLLHAIGHYVQQFHPGLQIRYVTTEQFMNEFIVAVQRKTIPEFHHRYRVADVLLVDDIQLLEGKERTQEEFFHTFNALHPKSQIVITSDRPPKKMSTLEERLRTRFEWGLITDIQPPDLETRLAILQKKAETENLPMPPEVLSLIATKVQTNIRELEGALIRVAAYASLSRTEITLTMAQQVLQPLLPDANEARVTPDLVIAVAGEYFGVTAEEICSPNRSRPLVSARQIAMYLCRELTDLSLPKIGERFGGRDHSTVVHADRKIKEEIRERQSSYEQVQELTTRIRQQAARG
jgi:chromosomal replication initiator protein